MPDDHADNPCVPQELVEEEIVPSPLYGPVHIMLLAWAVPMFLLNLLISFILFDAYLSEEFTLTLILFHASAIAFVVAYIGMFFRKAWAFGLCTISMWLWVALFFIELCFPQEEYVEIGPVFPGTLLLGLFIIFAVPLYTLSISVLSLILWVLSLKRKTMRVTG